MQGKRNDNYTAFRDTVIATMKVVRLLGMENCSVPYIVHHISVLSQDHKHLSRVLGRRTDGVDDLFKMSVSETRWNQSLYLRHNVRHQSPWLSSALPTSLSVGSCVALTSTTATGHPITELWRYSGLGRLQM